MLTRKKGISYMECAECSHYFSLSEVPLTNRNYGAWSCDFRCPECGTWLKISQAKKWLINLAIISASLFVSGLFLLKIINPFFVLIPGFFSVVFFWSSVKIKKTLRAYENIES